MKNNENINEKYVSIDSIYDAFSDIIDVIPLIISSADINTFYLDSAEYVTQQDFNKIQHIIYQKTTNTEFIIQNNSTLIPYEPYSNDTNYSLSIISDKN